MTETETVLIPAPEARCIACGCTDSAACPEGCYWVEVDYDAGVGLCSECSIHGDTDAAAVTELPGTDT